ncbi:hypothetical protein GCM10027055_10030 [Janibacter alkaliphilus]|uniref:Ferric siderophore reductase C-terminal domain-containing protein n=1 Tax=Janibacter alkaliphilus TaxID=1069963 RepID=A0A852X3N3_9MICO|nr:(2Fe-2S)-binding protein [Janibacter alkaliphilus]NYG35930.1 hypothetical protein [Janibacter alkaliphilus]
MPYVQAVTGGGPVPAWIDAAGEATVALNGVRPPGLAAASVLHYLLYPLAEVMAAAAVRTDWLLDPSPELWSLGLDPTYRSPALVQLRPGGHARVADDERRVTAARDAYLSVATPIADALPAPERMSSRQRRGLVADSWAGARARLAGSPPPRRVSCCLIYTLPGCHECAGCPRTA